MNFRLFTLVVACVAMVALVAGDAAAVVIYSDSFDRIEGSGDPNGKPADPNNFSAWGANDNALGGTTVNTWLVGPSRGGGANQVTDGALASTIDGGAHYDFDVTTLAPLGFTVEFDFNRFAPFSAGGTGNGYLAVGLGADTGSTPDNNIATGGDSDFGVLFQQGVGGNVGNTEFFEDGVSGGSPGPVDYGDPLADHSVKLTLVPAVAGSYGAGDTINGSLSVDGAAAYNFSVLGGTEFGKLAFSSNAFVHRAYDNLVVSAIPEPTTLALAGLVMVAGLSRRRR